MTAAAMTTATAAAPNELTRPAAACGISEGDTVGWAPVPVAPVGWPLAPGFVPVGTEPPAEDELPPAGGGETAVLTVVGAAEEESLPP